MQICRLSPKIYVLGITETWKKGNLLNQEGSQGRPSESLAESRRVSKASQAKKVVETFQAEGNKKDMLRDTKVQGVCLGKSRQFYISGVANVSWKRWDETWKVIPYRHTWTLWAGKYLKKVWEVKIPKIFKLSQGGWILKFLNIELPICFAELCNDLYSSKQYICTPACTECSP